MLNFQSILRINMMFHLLWNIKMKKIFFAVLLVAIASATHNSCESNSGESNSGDSNVPYYHPPIVCNPPPPPPPSCPPPPPPPPPPPKPLDRRFTLRLQYACRVGTSFHSCQGAVYWNGHKVGDLKPYNYGINVFKVSVKVNQGVNMLKIAGAGCSDSYGLTIDNVRLVRFGTHNNIVKNGGFQKPYLGCKKWRVFNDIPGWWGSGFEVGDGSLYNCRWRNQVVELDGHRNGYLTQKWKFNYLYKLI